jgi:hypothetical protein
MYSAPDDAALPASGLPIRRSAGQRLFSASPRLIAAVHVLLRLLVPRHPPYALSILTVSHPRSRAGVQITLWPLCSFQAPSEADRRRTSACGPSKLSSATELTRKGERGESGSGRHSGLLPRKEVIQPQLPLRLPCYDFTPITSPTFDGSLP